MKRAIMSVSAASTIASADSPDGERDDD